MDEPKLTDEQVNHQEHAHEQMDHAMHEEAAQQATHEQMDHAMHKQSDQHAGHNGHGAHADHSGHEQMFRRRFWVCLVLTIPVLLFSPLIQEWLGFHMPEFPGSPWI
ncbi:MAG: heavy metal translocating P-type ATPase, partial [Chloroflexota bacterium]